MERHDFSVVKRARSFANAGRGVFLMLKTTPNAWIELLVLAFVLKAGQYYHISGTDWGLIVFAAGLVFSAEAFNTAIEIDMDLTSPEYHPAARDTKDVAAGAVLIASVAAIVIGLIIFLPHMAI